MTPSELEEMDGEMESAGWGELESHLLRAGREQPPAGTERAVLSALGLGLPGAPGPGGPGGEALASSPGAAPVGTWGAVSAGGSKLSAVVLAKWVGVASLVAAAPVAWWLVTRAPDTQRPRAQQTNTSTGSQAIVAPAPRAVTAPGAEPALSLDQLPTEAPPVGTVKVDLTEAPTSNLAAELALLRRARAASSGGNPSEALTLLADYQKSFPSPQLQSEALVVRIEALMKLGRKEEARRFAQPLLATDSPYAERVRALVQ